MKRDLITYRVMTNYNNPNMVNSSNYFSEVILSELRKSTYDIRGWDEIIDGKSYWICIVIDTVTVSSTSLLFYIEISDSENYDNIEYEECLKLLDNASFRNKLERRIDLMVNSINEDNIEYIYSDDTLVYDRKKIFAQLIDANTNTKLQQPNYEYKQLLLTDYRRIGD